MLDTFSAILMLVAFIGLVGAVITGIALASGIVNYGIQMAFLFLFGTFITASSAIVTVVMIRYLQVVFYWPSSSPSCSSLN